MDHHRLKRPLSHRHGNTGWMLTCLPNFCTYLRLCVNQCECTRWWTLS